MTDTIHPLVLDLVEWIGEEPRRYGDVLEAWRTSCPRLPVWEEAVDRGYVAREPFDGRQALVSVTPSGLSLLQRNGRPIGGVRAGAPPASDHLSCRDRAS